jgi:hypothetical protein
VFFCSEILDKAALAEDNYEQMAYVAAFTLSAYRCLHCMFELHLMIWKREDGISKICEYQFKKPAKLICIKYCKFLNEENFRLIYTIQFTKVAGRGKL